MRKLILACLGLSAVGFANPVWAENLPTFNFATGILHIPKVIAGTAGFQVDLEHQTGLDFTIYAVSVVPPINFDAGLLHPSDNAPVSDDVLMRRWPNGVVPYKVVGDDKHYDETQFNNNNLWRELTKGAVRFVIRTTENPYIPIHLQSASRTNHLRGFREADGAELPDERDIYINSSINWDVN